MPERSLHRAFLSLGSNIEPEANLPAAVRELARYGTILAVSRVWEASPVGFCEQANFLNAAVLLETSLDAKQIRTELIPAIERKQNRVRDPHNVNAPRTIDVDLTLFDRDVLQVDMQRIPDPDLLTRAFVAVPIAELDPDYVHPEANRTLAEIAGDFIDAQSPMIARPDVDLAEAVVQSTATRENFP
jgi:2-amino-4-hydroxy-6-hydroxymethyldihydropteridine diphosphokinase